MELDEKNNDLDAMLHFKRTLNDVNKSERPADALAVKKYQSLSDNLKSRDASASKNSPKVYRVTLHLIRVHFHVILHGIHVSESAPCFSCTFTLVAENLK